MIKKKLGNIRLTRKTKGLIITICTAVLIGFIFGMFSLQMTKLETQPNEAKVYTSAQTKEEEQGVKTMADISFYVVQGGVFSEQANAEKSGKSFTDKGFIAFTWQREGQVYLLTGITSSPEEATSIANNMQAENLDVYVKEWEIDPIKVELPATDYSWLESMIQLWKKSLNTIEQDGTITQAEWKKIVGEDGLSSEPVLAMKQKIGELLQAGSQLNQEDLLEIIATYEENFNNG